MKEWATVDVERPGRGKFKHYRGALRVIREAFYLEQDFCGRPVLRGPLTYGDSLTPLPDFGQ